MVLVDQSKAKILKINKILFLYWGAVVSPEPIYGSASILHRMQKVISFYG